MDSVITNCPFSDYQDRTITIWIRHPDRNRYQSNNGSITARAAGIFMQVKLVFLVDIEQGGQRYDREPNHANIVSWNTNLPKRSLVGPGGTPHSVVILVIGPLAPEVLRTAAPFTGGTGPHALAQVGGRATTRSTNTDSYQQFSCRPPWLAG
ncbi:hypothetical protein H7H78_11010 [Mycobacterium shinjukuense]|uniref:hypothetical protein n=1 Tax=Mycobacterium shinjukuense TaxID=398694 RepID=UPI0015D2E9DC|nr:hypothetical protein [Mycobacterium shinjukuense]MCV6985942.1 hypothetical protein [Mycobacterium shinjukuense]